MTRTLQVEDDDLIDVVSTLPEEAEDFVSAVDENDDDLVNTLSAKTGVTIVRLLLTGDSDAKSPDYSPKAPVTGVSHYLVLKHDGRKVTLFHPWELVRFDIPDITFRRALFPEAFVTPEQLTKALANRIKTCNSLKPPRLVPDYVYEIQRVLVSGESFNVDVDNPVVKKTRAARVKSDTVDVVVKDTSARNAAFECVECKKTVNGPWSYKNHLVTKHAYSTDKATEQRDKQK